jgi:hypothetical protein
VAASRLFSPDAGGRAALVEAVFGLSLFGAVVAVSGPRPHHGAGARADLGAAAGATTKSPG